MAQEPQENRNPAVMSVPEFGRMLGIGKDLAYQMARQGDICGVPVLKLGRKLAVPRAAAERMLAGETRPGQDAARAMREMQANPAGTNDEESKTHRDMANDRNIPLLRPQMTVAPSNQQYGTRPNSSGWRARCPACDEKVERIPAAPERDFDWYCSNCGWVGTDESV